MLVYIIGITGFCLAMFQQLRNHIRRVEDPIGLVAIGWGLFLLYLVPVSIGGDGSFRFNALRELLTSGSVSSTRYSLIGPLFSVPLYLIGERIGDPRWWAEEYNFLVFGLGIIAFYFLLRRSLQRKTLHAFLLLLIFGSMFPHHVQHYYGEVFTAVLVGVGVTAAIVRQKSWGWLMMIIGVANTPASLIGALFVSLGRMMQRKRWQYIIIFFLSIGFILMEAWVRRGNPLVSGYEGNHGVTMFTPYSGRPGFSYPLFFGLLSLIFSFGKGLLFFTPGLFLELPKQIRLPRQLWECYLLWIVFLVGILLVYARWWAWSGALFWGPRFLLFACIPASFVLALRVHNAKASVFNDVVTCVALFLSFWVGLNGIVYGEYDVGICARDNWYWEPVCWYVPEFSVLWRPFVVPHALSSLNYLFFASWCCVMLYVMWPLFVRCSFRVQKLNVRAM